MGHSGQHELGHIAPGVLLVGGGEDQILRSDQGTVPGEGQPLGMRQNAMMQGGQLGAEILGRALRTVVHEGGQPLGRAAHAPPEFIQILFGEADQRAFEDGGRDAACVVDGMLGAVQRQALRQPVGMAGQGAGGCPYAERPRQKADFGVWLQQTVVERFVGIVVAKQEVVACRRGIGKEMFVGAPAGEEEQQAGLSGAVKKYLFHTGFRF